MSHDSSTALRLQKQRGHEAAGSSSKASSVATAREALPGTSLSAVQYSTVRDTTDRFGLAQTSVSPCRATGQTQKRHYREIWQEVGGGLSFELRATPGLLFFSRLHTLLGYLNIKSVFT